MLDFDDEYKRAIYGGAVWAAIASGLLLAAGADIDFTVVLTEGGLMAGSIVASDAVYDMLEKSSAKTGGKPPSNMVMAAVTGGAFAGLMAAVRGSDAYLQNFAAGAATDYATEKLLEAMDKMTAEAEAKKAGAPTA